jgi:hypothetical protein
MTVSMPLSLRTETATSPHGPLADKFVESIFHDYNPR